MSKVVKSKEDKLTLELIESLVGKYVHATTNVHELPRVDNPDVKEKVNVWFAGQVAGYEVTVIKYSFEHDTILDEPIVNYHLLLTDGVGYVLSDTELEILELTADEFIELVAEHTTKDAVNSILTPDESEKKILIPGKDF